MSKEEANKIRYSREVEASLKQFAKYANMGPKRQYHTRYEYMYEMSPERKARIEQLMSEGKTFEEAYDAERDAVKDCDSEADKCERCNHCGARESD
jgi:hypothetical protein